MKRDFSHIGPDRSLDLSFNNFRAVPETLHHLTSLKTVYFVQNRISKITGLETLGRTLRSLELGGNRIRVSPIVCPLVYHSEDRRRLSRTSNRSSTSRSCGWARTSSPSSRSPVSLRGIYLY
jgi:Leucine-rich repeat (LRR) protein